MATSDRAHGGLALSGALTTRALAGVDRLFEARAAEGHAPSASYGVFTRTGLIHTGSTGEVAGRAPTADTIYRIASCTKSFTATTLMALRDAGAVSLDDAVTDYVPAFGEVRLPTADSPVPTLRMLLTMSAGLPTDDPWGDRQEAWTRAELDAYLAQGVPTVSTPGTRFEYSNLGYALLGRVITVASGRAYRDVVTDSILRPLDLASTGFVRPDGADDRLAVGHRRLDDEWQPLPFSGPGGFSSIGGLFSTVTDLSRWARWLASAFDDETGPGEGGDRDGILSRASRRELQQASRTWPAQATQPTGYGFGLVVEEQPSLGAIVAHSGGYPGFSAHMRWHPASGLGIVAFENATYAQVAVPTTTALLGLLHEVEAVPRPRVWAEVAGARMAVEAAVVDGAELDDDLVSPNVEWDIPFTHRRAAWAEAITAIGGLVGRASTTPAGTVVDSEAGDESQAPSHLIWRLPGEHGRLRLEIRLTPEKPPRIQTLTVRAERL